MFKCSLCGERDANPALYLEYCVCICLVCFPDFYNMEKERLSNDS